MKRVNKNYIIFQEKLSFRKSMNKDTYILIKIMIFESLLIKWLFLLISIDITLIINQINLIFKVQ